MRHSSSCPFGSVELRAGLCAIDRGKDLFHPPFLVKVIERSQTERLKKLRSRPPDPLPPGPEPCRARNQLAVAQGLDGAGAFDTADGVDVAGRHRLLQRHDGQSLEGLRGDGLRPPLRQQAPDQLRILGLGLDAHPVRPAFELDAPVGGHQIRLELAQRLVCLILGDFEALGQGPNRDCMDWRAQKVDF